MSAGASAQVIELKNGWYELYHSDITFTAGAESLLSTDFSEVVTFARQHLCSQEVFKRDGNVSCDALSFDFAPLFGSYEVINSFVLDSVHPPLRNFVRLGERRKIERLFQKEILTSGSDPAMKNPALGEQMLELVSDNLHLEVFYYSASQSMEVTKPWYSSTTPPVRHFGSACLSHPTA